MSRGFREANRKPWDKPDGRALRLLSVPASHRTRSTPPARRVELVQSSLWIGLAIRR